MEDIYLVYYKNGNETILFGTCQLEEEAKALRKAAIKSEISDYEAYMGRIPTLDAKLIISWVKTIKIKLGEQLNLKL